MKFMWILFSLCILFKASHGKAIPAINWVFQSNSNLGSPQANIVDDEEQRAEPAKRSENVCNVKEEDRTRCSTAKSKQKCMDKGCCFDPKGSIKCFNKKDGSASPNPMKNDKTLNVEFCDIPTEARMTCIADSRENCTSLGCCWQDGEDGPACYHSNRPMFTMDRYTVETEDETKPADNSITVTMSSTENPTTTESTTKENVTTAAETTIAKTEEETTIATTEEETTIATTEEETTIAATEASTTTTTPPVKTTTTTESVTTKLSTTTLAKSTTTDIPSTTPSSTAAETTPQSAVSVKSVTLYCGQIACEDEPDMDEFNCSLKGCCVSKDLQGNYNGCFKYTWTRPINPTGYVHSTKYYIPTSSPTKTAAGSTTTTSPVSTTTTPVVTTTSSTTTQKSSGKVPNQGVSNPQQAQQQSSYPSPQTPAIPPMLLCLISRSLCVVQLLSSTATQPGLTQPFQPLVDPQQSNQFTNVQGQTQNNPQYGMPKTGDDNAIASAPAQLQEVSNLENIPLSSQNRMFSPNAPHVAPLIGGSRQPQSNPFGNLFNFGAAPVQQDTIMADEWNETATTDGNPAPPPVYNGPQTAAPTMNPMMMSLICPMLGKNSKFCEILPLLQQQQKQTMPELPDSKEWLDRIISIDNAPSAVAGSSLEIVKLLTGDEEFDFGVSVTPECENAKKAKDLYALDCYAYTQESCEQRGCCWSGDYYSSLMQTKGETKSPLKMMLMQQLMMGGTGGGMQGPMCIRKLTSNMMENILMRSIMAEANITEELAGMSLGSDPYYNTMDPTSSMYGGMSGSLSSFGAGSNPMSSLMNPSLGGGNSMSTIMSMMQMLKGNDGGDSSSSSSTLSKLMPLLGNGMTSPFGSPSSSVGSSLMGGGLPFGGSSASSGSSTMNMLTQLMGNKLGGGSSSPLGSTDMMNALLQGGGGGLSSMFGERSAVAIDAEHSSEDATTKEGGNGPKNEEQTSES